MKNTLRRVAVIMLAFVVICNTIRLEAFATALDAALDKLEEGSSMELEALSADENITMGTMGDHDGIQWVYDADTKTLTVTGEDSGLYGEFSSASYSYVSPFHKISADIQYIIMKDCKLIGSADYLFASLNNLINIEFSNIATSEVTNMMRMFSGCSNLVGLDVSGFDTGNVTDMSGMFNGCEKLAKLDVSGLDTSKVTNMSSMFLGCKNLTDINVSGFDTANVIYMEAMFAECTNLTNLDVSGFDTSKVIYMADMFSECTNLICLDLSNFNTSKVTWMARMFKLCSNLTSLNVSGFDTINVSNMDQMFYCCESLSVLDLSSFDMSNVEHKDNFLGGCSELSVIHTPQNIAWTVEEIRLSDFYDSNMQEVKRLDRTQCNKILTKKVDESESLIPDNKYLICVVDSKGNPVKDANVSYDVQMGVTDSEGKIQFDRYTAGKPEITVSKENYITWKNDYDEYEANSFRYETIVLYLKEEGELKLKHATYLSTPKVNLLTRVKTLDLKLKGDNTINITPGGFKISCQAIDKSIVKEYQLWQKNKHIATSGDGNFSLDVGDGFVEGGDCYIKVISKSGITLDTKINLNFAANNVNENSGVSLMDESISIAIGDNVPYFGGGTVSIDVPKLPMNFQVTEEKIYFGFNISLYNKEFGETKEQTDSEIEEYYKGIKEDIDKIKQIKNTPLSRKNLDNINKLIEEPKKFRLVGGEFDVSVLGYAEADYGSKTAKGELLICIKATAPTLEYNVVVLVVPVTIQIEASIEGQFGGEISYNYETGVFDGSINVNIIVELNAFAGFGVGKVIGVGVYGDATATAGLKFLGQYSGLQKIDLTGELGIKAYVGILSYEKGFAHKTWHLYSPPTTENAAAATCESVQINSLTGMYEADNYKVEALDYLTEESAWNGSEIPVLRGEAYTHLVSLLEGTYRNAQPVMVSDGNTLYAAFLRADQETGEVYVATTKMEGGMWSEPVRADDNTLLDNAPQLVIDDDGVVWMAYSKTKVLENKNSLLEYAQNQSIVIGTLNPDTLEFSKVMEYEGTDYAHMQRLGLMDGVPALTWVESVVTDDNSVLLSRDNKVMLATYKDGVWSEASNICTIKHPVSQLILGDTELACVVDVDNDVFTTEDYTLISYDLQGMDTTIATGVTGKVSYAILSGDVEPSFVWNAENILRNSAKEINVAGITNEYVICGSDIYYSAANGVGAELAVVRKNSDNTYREPIFLTDTGKYLENLSVAKVSGGDVVFGMDTSVEISDEDVIPNKDLVWAIVQPVNDIRIDSVDYEPNITTVGETVPVTLTITNVGDHGIDELQISVNQSIMDINSMSLAAGATKEVTIHLICPEALTEYEIQVIDKNIGIEGDYTQENNTTTLKLGYTNIEVDAYAQQVSDAMMVIAEVRNIGIETSNGTLKMYHENGQLLGVRCFNNLKSGDTIHVDMPLLVNENPGTITIMVESEQEELYTYDNHVDVYLPRLVADTKLYHINYFLGGGEQNEDNPSTYQSVQDDIVLYAPVKTGYQFEGWYKDNLFSEQITCIKTGSSGNIRLYAKWVPNTYAVEFSANGGKGSMENMDNLSYGEKYELMCNVYNLDGYTFTEWNTKADGSGIGYADGATIKNLTSENGTVVKLYAQWEKVVEVTPSPTPTVTPSPTPTVTPSPTPVEFEDVEADAYYETPVQWAVEKGITNGYGSNTTFCPDLVCTRGQIVTFLWRAKGCPEPASLENPFIDVATDAYYYKAVLWAVEQGITNGYGSANTFCPDGECTRGQVATFMWRAEDKQANRGSNPFVDLDESAYYYDAVLWAVEKGVTNGYGSVETFCPDRSCTRGQIVTFLYRGMN